MRCGLIKFFVLLQKFTLCHDQSQGKLEYGEQDIL
jgi:hypothetical protein